MRLHKSHTVNRLGLENKRNLRNKEDIPLPAISFKEKSDDLEIDKMTMVKLLVSEKTRYGNNNLKVLSITENKNISFTTTK